MKIAITESSILQDKGLNISGAKSLAPQAKEKKKKKLARLAPNAYETFSYKVKYCRETVPINTTVSK